MSISALPAVARVVCLATLGFVASTALADNRPSDPMGLLGDPSTGFSCGYSVASDGVGMPRVSAVDSFASFGFGVCVSQMTGVTLTKEVVSGRRAVVASKRVNGPIADSTRAMFSRAGYSQFGQTYFCRDAHYLLQPSQRYCFNLLPPL
jgi:hypothetical protein